MARLSNKSKKEIIKAAKSGMPVSKIAEDYGISTSAVYYILKNSGIKKSKKAAPKEEIEKEAEASEPEDDEIDYKAWMEFWQGKYVEVHLILVQHNLA